MAEPALIADILKEHRARWPTLFKETETGAASFETRAARLETKFPDTQAAPIISETRAASPETGKNQPITRAEKSLTDQLVSLFGKGDNPSLRMTLYMRIELTCQTFGAEADLVLRDVIDAARTKRNPGNYFAFSIVRRFRENGFFGGELS